MNNRVVNTTERRVFAVWWRDLERWVVPSSALLGGMLPTGWSRPRIGSIVTQITTRSRVEAATSYKMAGVKWYGDGVFHRETVRGDEMSANQVTPVVPGAVIYNRLFAWKGSFAVVTPEFSGCYVSSEFPQFIPDKSRVLPEYLHIFFTLESTVHAVSSASTGSAAVSRNRFKEEQFLNFEIPLPPLKEQRRIIERWENAKKAESQAREIVSNQNAQIMQRFASSLGLAIPSSTTSAKAFCVSWKDFHRWGVDFNFLRQTGIDLSTGKYPTVRLGSILDMVQYGTSEKANTSDRGIALIRMNNVVDGQLDLKNIKHVALREVEENRLLLNEGDILINRTNSKELVGKCAVFHSTGKFVFASYLIRVKANSLKADPDFLAYVINSPIGRQQINALSRQIIGQANINSEEIRSLEIPLPPLSVQQAIMKQVNDGRAEVVGLIQRAEDFTQSVLTEIETLISGIKARTRE